MALVQREGSHSAAMPPTTSLPGISPRHRVWIVRSFPPSLWLPREEEPVVDHVTLAQLQLPSSTPHHRSALPETIVAQPMPDMVVGPLASHRSAVTGVPPAASSCLGQAERSLTKASTSALHTKAGGIRPAQFQGPFAPFRCCQWRSCRSRLDVSLHSP